MQIYFAFFRAKDFQFPGDENSARKTALTSYSSPVRQFCSISAPKMSGSVLSSKWQQSGKLSHLKINILTFEIIFHSFSPFFSFAGSAKKRDVRTINSSPCDLGPPSKTSTNGVNGTPKSNARTIATLREYFVLFKLRMEAQLNVIKVDCVVKSV